jgi:hypothetical protein
MFINGARRGHHEQVAMQTVVAAVAGRPLLSVQFFMNPIVNIVDAVKKKHRRLSKELHIRCRNGVSSSTGLAGGVAWPDKPNNTSTHMEKIVLPNFFPAPMYALVAFYAYLI